MPCEASLCDACESVHVISCVQNMLFSQVTSFAQPLGARRPDGFSPTPARGLADPSLEKSTPLLLLWWFRKAACFPEFGRRDGRWWVSRAFLSSQGDWW